MDRQTVTELIQANQGTLTQLGVEALSIFGSVARGDSNADSDIDFLVRFHGRASFDRYMDLKLFLEDLLGHPVDLVTEQGLRQEIRASVERDLMRVA